MALTRIACPECGAGLTSKAGFVPGKSVTCLKCEADFTVPEPPDADDEDDRPKKKPVRAAASRADDDEDDDRPKKKKKKRRAADDEDEGGGKSYKNSPVRFIVLGVLLVVMIVLGVMLILKKQKEKEDAQAGGGDPDDAPAAPGNVAPRFPQGQAGPPGMGPAQPGGGFRPNGLANPAVGVAPKFPPGQGGFPPGNVAGKFGNPPVTGGGPAAGGGPFDVFGGTPGANTPAGQKLIATLSDKLVGTWEGTAPDGTPHRVTYKADGTFTHAAGGKETAGTWTVPGLIGSRGLKVQRTGPKPLNVVFEGDELIHDTGPPGETVVLRKK